MRRRLLPLIISAFIVPAAGIAGIVLFSRSPVLVVTDHSFSMLYGAARIRLEMARSSLALFRPVRPVAIADDAGDDMLLLAIENASSRPYCVIFPLRFAGAAGLYCRQFPEIPAVLLEGSRNTASGRNSHAEEGYFLFRTDMEDDFYRAGLCAAIIDSEKNGRIAVFLEDSPNNPCREAFMRGLRDQKKTNPPIFAQSIQQISDFSDISCVVLAVSGADYLETTREIPVIFFTWLNPSMVPNSTVLIFDDSPWAQAVRVARMAASGTAEGNISSRILIFSAKIDDKSVLNGIKNAAGKGWGLSVH